MSEWDAESAKRRDFRHSKAEPEVPRHRAKNNGRKSCKKSPDGIHTFQRDPDREWFSMFASPLRCVYCGRIEF